jgi:hypothetical protein
MRPSRTASPTLATTSSSIHPDGGRLGAEEVTRLIDGRHATGNIILEG